MKLRNIAVACAAGITALSAAAQSNITIYGRANVTLERQKAGGVKDSVVQNNASRIGFRGTEDLGGGLKAGFMIEHGFSIDTGSQTQPAFWARGSEVNLSGGFGMVRLGNFTSEAYYATADYVSLHNHDTGTSSDAFYAYVSRNRDKVAYRTPSLNGLTAELAVSASDGFSGGPPPSDKTYDLAANYAVGPLQLGAGYAKDGDANQFALRALYSLGPWVFGGYIQRDEDGLGAGLGDRTTLRLSGMYVIGTGEVHANYGRAGKYSNVPNSSANQFTLAYNHNLSKRTKVYTFYTKVDDKGTIYGDFSSLALGIRHNF